MLKEQIPHRRYGSLERTGYLTVSTLGVWVVLKELILTVSNLGGCGGLKELILTEM